MITDSSFSPAWWLSNAHVQTIAAKWLRRNETFTGIKSTLETPDNDFIDLVWTHTPSKDNKRPIVVILHGLAGSADSHYAKGMLNKVADKGWVGVLMHFRGCSGRPNKQARSYHSGDIRDITFFTEWLSRHFPESPLAAIGFSLGGNVLTRYLASTPSNPYKATSIICAPLDLASCSQRISKGFSQVYQKYLVDLLKKVTFEKISMNLLPQISPEKLQGISKLWDFDEMITAPINGFEGAEHYYQSASGKFVLHEINTPSLFIHAADDPFLEHSTIVPNQKLPESITFEVCQKGGHVGFISGTNPFKPSYWLEERVPHYLEQYL